ncbi:MAG: GYD domain-containing protein, partial [Chloroflexota bacterium]|nr:GYD domain-containing protein [Chloroflexota bacterium]
VGQMGGSVDALLWTMGRYDIVAVIDALSDEAASAIVLKVTALGNVQGETLRAFTADEVAGIVGNLG